MGCRRPPCCKLLKHPKAHRGALGAAPQQPGEIGTQSLLHRQFPDTGVLSNSELQLEPTPKEPWGGLIRANYWCSLRKGQPQHPAGKGTVPGCCPSVEGGKLCRFSGVPGALAAPCPGCCSPGRAHPREALNPSGCSADEGGWSQHTDTPAARFGDISSAGNSQSIKGCPQPATSSSCREPGMGGGGESSGGAAGPVQAARVAGATRLTWVSPW